MTEEKKYQIGDKIYVQRPLVLEEIWPIYDYLDEYRQSDFKTERDFIKHLVTPRFLSLVVKPEGTLPEDHDSNELEKVLTGRVPPDIGFEMVSDFFGFNRLALASSRLVEAMNGLTRILLPPGNGSRASSASSLREISQKEILSDGA